MFYPKQDIFSQNWLDIIFEGRNKQYGAYVLRKNGAKTANTALFVASSVFVIILLIPLIQDRLFPDNTLPSTSNTLDPEVVVALIPPPPIDPSIPNPPPSPPSAPRTSQVRMVTPVVVNANIATEEPPSVTMLRLADPGSKTLEGNPDVAIHINVPAGLGSGDAETTESTNMHNTPFVHVEIAPEFPGGMEAFYQYVKQNYRYPPSAVEHGVRGKVVLQFIVERDGSLTSIKIIRDLKFGTGEEAVRLLMASPKWTPGIQNGRTVRVAYTLPIGLAITQ